MTINEIRSRMQDPKLDPRDWTDMYYALRAEKIRLRQIVVDAIRKGEITADALETFERNRDAMSLIEPTDFTVLDAFHTLEHLPYGDVRQGNRSRSTHDFRRWLHGHFMAMGGWIAVSEAKKTLEFCDFCGNAPDGCGYCFGSH